MLFVFSSFRKQSFVVEVLVFLVVRHRCGATRVGRVSQAIAFANTTKTVVPRTLRGLTRFAKQSELMNLGYLMSLLLGQARFGYVLWAILIVVLIISRYAHGKLVEY